MGGDLLNTAGRFRPEALELRGAQPLIMVVVELDGSMTWLAPNNMDDRHLETIKRSFFTWLAEYKHARREGKGRVQTPP